MIEFKVLKIHQNRPQFSSEEGWKFAPLHWLYAVKHDGRHKARLVIGGNVTDSEGYNTFASTIHMEHVRLQVFLTAFFWRGYAQRRYRICIPQCRNKRKNLH